MKKDLLPIGRVAKPHGVSGKIKIDYFGEDLNHFLLYREIFIKDHTGRLQAYDISEVVPQTSRLIIKVKGIERREEVEPLVGREIFIKMKSLPDLEEGEHYWFEILGMVVETEKGKRIGRIKEILPTGANDVYVVEGKSREIFLPAIEEVIQSIDVKAGRMKVIWMEGLWEQEDEI
jgi:16S rRNA processing protein RimM